MPSVLTCLDSPPADTCSNLDQNDHDYHDNTHHYHHYHDLDLDQRLYNQHHHDWDVYD